MVSAGGLFLVEPPGLTITRAFLAVFLVSRDSSVTTVTGCVLDYRGTTGQLPAKTRDFSSPKD